MWVGRRKRNSFREGEKKKCVRRRTSPKTIKIKIEPQKILCKNLCVKIVNGNVEINHLGRVTKDLTPVLDQMHHSPNKQRHLDFIQSICQALKTLYNCVVVNCLSAENLIELFIGFSELESNVCVCHRSLCGIYGQKEKRKKKKKKRKKEKKKKKVKMNERGRTDLHSSEKRESGRKAKSRVFDPFLKKKRKKKR